MPEVPDHLDDGLSILFIGFNPSLQSGETGHHYANPRNNFYRILHRSGLTPRLYDASEDQDLLKLGYGFTNIVARPTRGVDDIERQEYAEGREILRENCGSTCRRSPVLSAKACTRNTAGAPKWIGDFSRTPSSRKSMSLWPPAQAGSCGCRWRRSSESTAGWRSL